jgi:energy-coupling factor transport system permease protein
MDMFLYLDKGTLVHRLDPRTKLAVMVATFAAALAAESLAALAVLAAAVAAYGQCGQVLGNLRRIKIILAMIFLASVALWSFLGQGADKLLGPVTAEGLLYGVATGVKLNIMIIAGMIFLSATKIEEISLGLQKLRIPYRAAFAFSTAIRLVPTIVGTSYIIIQAQRSRGLDLDSGGPLTRIRKYVPLLIPVFVSVIRGTHVFAMALESKGFGYSDRRTSYLETAFKTGDYIVFAALILAALVLRTASVQPLSGGGLL